VGTLCCVGRGFGRAGGFGSARCAGLGWAWDLAVLGALCCLAREVWAVLGALGFGSGGLG